jgi:hypothetical protein
VRGVADVDVHHKYLKSSDNFFGPAGKPKPGHGEPVLSGACACRRPANPAHPTASTAITTVNIYKLYDTSPRKFALWATPKIVNMLPKHTYRNAASSSGRAGNRPRYLAIISSPNGIINAQIHTTINVGTKPVKSSGEVMVVLFRISEDGTLEFSEAIGRCRRYLCNHHQSLSRVTDGLETSPAHNGTWPKSRCNFGSQPISARAHSAA